MRRKDRTLEDFKDEEIVEYVLAKPGLRQQLIERIKEDVADALDATLVEAIRRANERPPVWWQWLMLFVFGAMAGTGLGIIIAIKGGIVGAGAPVPPPP